jgi:hypothetical protein
MCFLRGGETARTVETNGLIHLAHVQWEQPDDTVRVLPYQRSDGASNFNEWLLEFYVWQIFWDPTGFHVLMVVTGLSLPISSSRLLG